MSATIAIQLRDCREGVITDYPYSVFGRDPVSGEATSLVHSGLSDGWGDIVLVMSPGRYFLQIGPDRIPFRIAISGIQQFEQVVERETL